MNPDILEELSRISDTERSVMAENYSSLSDAEPIFANLPLRRRDYLWNVLGTRQPVSARPHTRFVDIPVHSHSYLEMMYVCAGSVTHLIEGQTLVLKEGELLLMNRHVTHAITASGAEDIAVNFLLSPDFLSYAAPRFRSDPHLRAFADEDRREDGKGRYLLFSVGDHPSLQNLLENLIRDTLLRQNTPHALLADTMSLFFRYVENEPSLLIRNPSEKGEEDTLRRKIGDYLETSYRTATLSELADLVGMTAPYVSRRVKELFGASFSELVKEKRFAEAERLLLQSDIPVSAIAEAIGYENNSFFHRRFREQYGTSPSRWRKRGRGK
jgi:AraC-like DNA-binding protein/mannose-6-phosphate isomerase-like protein (cupin superfamily)